MESIFLVLVLIGFWLLVALINSIFERLAEIRKYNQILRESIEKIKSVDFEKYEILMDEYETLYDSYKQEKIKIKNSQGRVFNICPKCGSYMKVVKWRGDPFLGCSNYPNCKFPRKLEEIFDLEV